PDVDFSSSSPYSTPMPLLQSRSCERQLAIWCRLRFLDEAVQQHHHVVIHREEHARDAVLQIRPDFIKPFAEWPAHRHANGPTELDGFDVFSNLLAILTRHCEQPVAHWCGT